MATPKVKQESKETILGWFKDPDQEYKREQIVRYIQDTKIPFEDRKEVWLNTPEHLGTNEGWILHLTKFDEKYGKISWFDDFYCDYRQRVHLPDLVADSFFEDDDDEFDEQKQNDFITECMEKGIHSFTLIW